MLDKTPQSLLAGFSILPYSAAYLLYSFLSSQELMGLPKFLNTSLPACHGLKTPADLHILAITDVLVLPSVNLKPLGIRLLGHLEVYQHFRVRNYPCGLQNPLSTLCPFICSHFRAPQRTQDSIRVGS